MDLNIESKDIKLNIPLKELEDPTSCLFKLSALVTDHYLRSLQRHVGRTLKNCDGITGKVVAINTKAVTVEPASGEKRREHPITPKLVRALNKGPQTQTRRASPRAAHATATTR